MEDRTLKQMILILAGLIVFGVIMVFSSSYIYAKESFGSSSFFFLRQVFFVVLGSGALFVAARTKFSFWYKYSFIFLGISTFFLVLSFVPGIGVELKGSYRWIKIFGLSFQPGEIEKYAILLASLFYFENFEELDKNERWVKGIFLSLPLSMNLLQPDYGTFCICLLLISFVSFMSRFPRKYFFSFIGSMFVVSMIALISAPYRVKRLMVFLDPWKDPKNSGFQIIQSYLAFANGHFWGQGIGNSNEKLFYLPEAHNDFIFSVIGEEIGFVGVALIAVAFLMLVGLGFKLAIAVKSRISAIFISAVLFAIGIQAFLNMSVVLGLLPTKGLNLPFISYGGTSMVVNLAAVGLLISAYRDGLREISFQGNIPSTGAMS
ncbi:MAG: putative lipid II flippase FtsW [Bacteriovoracaceae bacterium]|jgi:cell division protein FtsW|nr:putative lipid II flippase FtsW [Bacteriovoracaceae bacterium]